MTAVARIAIKDCPMLVADTLESVKDLYGGGYEIAASVAGRFETRRHHLHVLGDSHRR